MFVAPGPLVAMTSAEPAEKKESRETRVDGGRYGNIVFGAPLSRKSHFVRQVGRAGGRVFGRPYFKLIVHNKERIPETGAAIIAPSHRSNLDTPLVGMALDRWMRFMAKDSMFKSVFWSNFLVALGGFPVRRGKLDRRTLNNSFEVLERGEVLVIFPEGARQSGPRIKPIFEGVAWVAARSGLPVIPLGIGGSEAAQPIGVKIPRPQAVHFVVGEPLAPPQPLPGKKRVSRQQLDGFSAELREALQAAFDEAQASAGTPNAAWTDEDDQRREPWEE